MKSITVVATALLGLGCWAAPDERLSADQAERNQFRGAIRRIEERLTLRQVMDTLPMVLATLDTSRVSVRGFPADDSSASASLGDAARRVWAHAVPDDGPNRLLIWAYDSDGHDSTGATWSAARGTLWPEATDGRTCVLFQPHNADGNVPRGIDHGWLERVLTPCVYRARFGQPGLAFRAWLERTGHGGVSRGDWLWRPGAAGVGQWFGSNEVPTLPDLVRNPLFVLWFIRQGDGTPWYRAGPDQIRCLDGATGSCERAMLWPSPWSETRSTTMAGWLREPGDWDRPVRPGVWISELIRTRGEDRFASWWKSDRDLPGAFARVYGVPMDQAVREFARVDARRGGDERPPPLGPSIGGGDVVSTLAWIGLLVLVPLLGSGARSRGRR